MFTLLVLNGEFFVYLCSSVITSLFYFFRFYFGKNKVMSLALGRTTTEEYRDSLHEISKNLKGQTGLLFTNKTKDEVIE